MYGIANITLFDVIKMHLLAKNDLGFRNFPDLTPKKIAFKRVES